MKKFAAVLFFVLLFQVCAGRATAPSVHLANSINADQLLPKPSECDTLEYARLECIYEQTDVDTVLSQSRDEFFLLSIGDVYSLYKGYSSFRLDSACKAMNWNITYAQGDSLSDIYLTSGQLPEVLYDMRTDVFTVNEYNLFDFYQYEDSTARFFWTLLPDTTEVCGYVCRKAEATFRGIRWTAWYAPEIPLGIGPWKFNGLPGLVLWAYDDKGTHDVKLTAVRRSAGTRITFQTEKRFRAKRERVNSQMRRFKTGMQPYDSATGFPMYEIDKQGNRKPMPAVRRFYVPYELE